MKRMDKVAFFVIIPVLMSAQALSQDDPQRYLEKLASLMKQGAVTKIKVTHSPDSIATRVAVSKDALQSIANSTLEFSDHIPEKFGPLLLDVSTKKGNHTPDLRWGVSFYDAHTARRSGHFSSIGSDNMAT